MVFFLSYLLIHIGCVEIVVSFYCFLYIAPNIIFAALAGVVRRREKKSATFEKDCVVLYFRVFSLHQIRCSFLARSGIGKEEEEEEEGGKVREDGRRKVRSS